MKDARNGSLINVIAMSPKEAMSLKEVDCEGQVKEGAPQIVVDIMRDNAMNCRVLG